MRPKKSRARSAEAGLSFFRAADTILNSMFFHKPRRWWEDSGGDVEKLVEQARTKLRRAGFTGQKYSSILPSVYRTIWAPDDDLKREQRSWGRRFGGVRSHPSSWGFARGRSCKTCCESHLRYWNADAAGQLSFLSMDMENFFHSFTEAQVRLALEKHGFRGSEPDDAVEACMVRVDVPTLVGKVLPSIARQTVLRKGGDGDRFYPTSPSGTRGLDVARMGHSIVTPETVQLDERQLKARELFDERIADPSGGPAHELLRELVLYHICGFRRGMALGDRFLLQGSPASPPMTNLCMKVMDYRIAAYAKASDAFYSRYADDITLSWRRRRGKKAINTLGYGVRRILSDEQLVVNPSKTMIMGPGMRQKLLGYNVNAGRVTVSTRRRARIRRDIQGFLNGTRTDTESLASLRGEIEFVRGCHPEEADRLIDMVEQAEASITGTRGMQFFGGEIEADGGDDDLPGGDRPPMFA